MSVNTFFQFIKNNVANPIGNAISSTATEMRRDPKKLILFVASAALFAAGTHVALSASAARLAYNVLQMDLSLTAFFSMDVTSLERPEILAKMQETTQQVLSRVNLAPTELEWIGFVVMAVGAGLLVGATVQAMRSSEASQQEA